jgi:hypothetical protein
MDQTVCKVDWRLSGIRKAIAAGIPAIRRVRYSVQENILRPGVISDADVQEQIRRFYLRASAFISG